MSDLVRFSVSVERPLYEKLEALVAENEYTNRSEYVRDLIRDKLVHQEWEAGDEAIGTVTLIYNHHLRQLSEKLTAIQHSHHQQIMAVTHVHLDNDLCVEAILIKAPAADIRHITNALQRQKGVIHAGLTMSTTGKKIAGEVVHHHHDPAHLHHHESGDHAHP